MVLAGNPFFGPDGWATVPPATVIGLRGDDTSSDVVRACLRGICYAIRSMLDCLAARATARSGRVTATGGMSRSAAWSQLLADVVGQPVTVPALDRIAGRGGALLVAGESTGTAASRTFFPNPDAAAMHAAGLARYQTLYRAAQTDTHDRLVTGARTR